MGNGLTKEERAFIKDREDRRIARDPMYAIQRARKANGLPPAPERRAGQSYNYGAQVDMSDMDKDMKDTIRGKAKK